MSDDDSDNHVDDDDGDDHVDDGNHAMTTMTLTFDGATTMTPQRMGLPAINSTCVINSDAEPADRPNSLTVCVASNVE